MAAFQKLPSGNRRGPISRKGTCVPKTLRRCKKANGLVPETERHFNTFGGNRVVAAADGAVLDVMRANMEVLMQRVVLVGIAGNKSNSLNTRPPMILDAPTRIRSVAAMDQSLSQLRPHQ